MVKYKEPQLDAIFGSLSDATRREMLKRLMQQNLTVGELAAPLDISLAAASKHIKVLENAGLISRKIEGRTHHCRLEPHALHGGLEWIRYFEKFWQRNLDVLEALLQAEDSPKKRSKNASAHKKRNE